MFWFDRFHRDGIQNGNDITSHFLMRKKFSFIAREASAKVDWNFNKCYILKLYSKIIGFLGTVTVITFFQYRWSFYFLNSRGLPTYIIFSPIYMYNSVNCCRCWKSCSDIYIFFKFGSVVCDFVARDPKHYIDIKSF